jgi:hypothetical protein
MKQRKKIVSNKKSRPEPEIIYLAYSRGNLKKAVPILVKKAIPK